MAKNNKMSNKTTENVPSKTVATEVPPVATQQVEATKPSPKRAASKSVISKEKSVPSVAPVEVAPVDTIPHVDSVVPVQSSEMDAADSSISVKMSLFGAKLHQLTGLLSSIKSDYKQLDKIVSRELKNAQKSSRRKKSSGNRQPSGFVKPTLISDELAQFLNKAAGSEMARTDVSKEINAYIRSNSLQDKTNGRKIIADAKLARLLKLGPTDELTYFNLQRYMKHHFVKTDPVVAAASVARAVATA